MYDRKKIEEALEALSLGFSFSQAAELAGVAPSTVEHWSKGRLPLSWDARGARIAVTGHRGEAARMTETRAPYDPPASGPLAGLSPDQVENLLLRAVLDDLKGGGSPLGSMSSGSKCELGERLRRAKGLPLRCVTAFLRISKSSYEYQEARLGRDRCAWLRPWVRELFAWMGGGRGYRAVWAELRRRGARASKKVVRFLMREEGLRARGRRRRRRRPRSSYRGEASPAPPNLPLLPNGTHLFRAGRPNELWVTGITEFRLPSGERCHLSPVIDCFDGGPVSWSVGPRPTAAVADSSLAAACATLAPGEAPVVHSDRGFHYSWPGWVAPSAGTA